MRKQFIRFEDLMDQNRSELLNDEDALNRLDDRIDARTAEKELKHLKKLNRSNLNTPLTIGVFFFVPQKLPVQVHISSSFTQGRCNITGED